MTSVPFHSPKLDSPDSKSVKRRRIGRSTTATAAIAAIDNFEFRVVESPWPAQSAEPGLDQARRLLVVLQLCTGLFARLFLQITGEVRIPEELQHMRDMIKFFQQNPHHSIVVAACFYFQNDLTQGLSQFGVVWSETLLQKYCDNVYLTIHTDDPILFGQTTLTPLTQQALFLAHAFVSLGMYIGPFQCGFTWSAALLKRFCRRSIYTPVELFKWRPWCVFDSNETFKHFNIAANRFKEFLQLDYVLCTSDSRTTTNMTRQQMNLRRTELLSFAVSALMKFYDFDRDPLLTSIEVLIQKCGLVVENGAEGGTMSHDAPRPLYMWYFTPYYIYVLMFDSLLDRTSPVAMKSDELIELSCRLVISSRVSAVLRSRSFEKLTNLVEQQSKALKDSSRAYEAWLVCKKALLIGDGKPNVEEPLALATLIDISTRAIRLCKRLKKNLEDESAISFWRFNTPTERIVKVQLASEKINNRTGFFVRSLDNEEIELVCAEDRALRYYKEKGWKGIYCECFHFILFFSLLLVDEIFADIDCMFPFPIQGAPLDFRTPNDFYNNRRSMLDSRFSTIQEMSSLEIRVAIEKGWNKVLGKYVQSLKGMIWLTARMQVEHDDSTIEIEKDDDAEEEKQQEASFDADDCGINIGMFVAPAERIADKATNPILRRKTKFKLQDLQDMAASFGGMRMSALLKQLVLFRPHDWQGWPDLFLYKGDNQVLLSEVKGPHDSLSNFQRAWFCHFERLNIPGEICILEGTN